MPEGQLPASMYRPPRRINGRASTAGLYGCLLRVQPDQVGQGWLRKDFIHHQLGFLLLQSNAIWTQECGRYVSKADEQDVRTSDWEKRSILRGGHFGKKPIGRWPFGRLQGNLWYHSILQHEAKSEQMSIWGDGWKIPVVHGILERYWGQPEQDTGNNEDDAANKHQGSTKPQWQSSCTKQVRFKSNKQMSAFLPHIEEVLQVDG